MSHAPARRIGFCIEGDELGGAELAVENLLLAASGDWDFVLLGPDNASTRRIAETTGVETVRLPDRREQRRRPDKLRRTLGAAQLDLLQVTLCNPTAASLPLIAGLSLRLPVIGVEQLVRPIYSKKRRLLKAFLARLFAAHVAVGKASSSMTEDLCWLSRGSVRTIYNGVRVPARQASPRDRSAISNLVTVGRLEHQKGLDLLVDAVAQVEDVDLTIVGDGTLSSSLMSQTRALHIDHRVHFAGWQDDPLPFLNAADVFVSGSRQEAFPHAVVEAMLAGLPVVATDVGSVREAVIRDETGVLVEPENAGELGKAIQRLVDDPSAASKLGDRGRALAESKFTDIAMAQQYESLWRTVLSPAL